MRHLRILLLLCVASRLAVAQGAAAPYSIKNDVLGESVETYKQNHRDEKHDCVVKKQLRAVLVPSLQNCVTLAINQTMTYATWPVKGRGVDFDDGKLYQVYLSFTSALGDQDAQYTALLVELTEKFGKPTSVRDADFQNAYGAHFANQTATWKNGVSTMSLTKYSDDLTVTSLLFMLDALEEDAQQKGSARIKPKSDM